MIDEEAIVHWPAWYYGPDSQAEIFMNEDEVPDGWVDAPAKVGGADVKAPKAAPTESPYKDFTDAEVIAELKRRALEFGPTWGRTKLEKTLLDDDKKAK